MPRHRLGGVLVRCVLLSVVVWSPAAPASAVDMFWSNSRGDGSGTFSVAVNWTESAPFSSPPPDANDVAHFGMTTSDLIPKTYTVTFTNSPTNRQAIVEDDRVTFDLNSHVYTLTNTSVAMRLGTVSGRSGRLTVTDGTLALPFQSDVEIGSVVGSSGVLTVGAGGLVLGSAELLVGLNGAGTLGITSGGDVIADSVRVGVNSGSSGIATITGAGSALDVRKLQVGFDGVGTLDINSGGQVDAVEADIAGNFFDSTIPSLGTVNVDGAGSTWDVDQRLTIGGLGEGRLNITGGGHVMSGFVVVGDRDGRASQVNVSSAVPGADSVLTIGTAGLLLGDFNTGASLTIGPGGVVSVAGFTAVGLNGRLRLHGGTLQSSEFAFHFFQPDQFSWVAGTLQVGTYHRDLTVPNGGVLAPVRAIDGTTIKGNYDQQAAGATLAVEIGGPIQFTNYGVVTTDGAAALGGRLQLNLTGGFVPTALNSFDILRATGGITGAFANVANGQRLTTSDGLGSFRVNYGPGSEFNPDLVILSAFQASVPGDFEFDGDVDGNDFLVWQRGGSPNPLSASDLAGWRATFGSGGSVAASGAVPEPGGGWLAMAAISLACAFRARSAHGVFTARE